MPRTEFVDRRNKASKHDIRRRDQTEADRRGTAERELYAPDIQGP
jgi:hypothetical protein